MRISLVLLACTALLSVACAPTAEQQPDEDVLGGPAGTTPATAPPAPTPALTESCPYLDADFVARANGQRVPKVEVSDTADSEHPSCFFAGPDGATQLSVRVYTGDAGVAQLIVDEATPVETSNPASDPPGWHGGYLAGDDGSVYAVFSEGTAVVVESSQAQSIKAKRVAEEVIRVLRL